MRPVPLSRNFCTDTSGIGSRGRGPDQPRSFLLGFADLTAANAQAMRVGAARRNSHDRMATAAVVAGTRRPESSKEAV